MKKALFLFTLLSLAITSYSQNHFNAAKIDSLIALVVEHKQMMGSVALAKNGTIIYQKAFGIAAPNNALSNINTKYRIGSITKMFTATMVMQLAEEHKLSLDDKLAKYYPQLPNAHKITIANLLNHHSGLYNFTDSAYLTYYTKPKTQEELLSIFATQKPVFEPGERAEYSNTNYVLLGFIIEQTTKKSYAANLQQRIVKKLELKNTYTTNHANVAKNEARSFHKDDKDNWALEDETDMSIPGGAGCIVSTPADLTLFITSLFQGKLVSKTSLDLMKIMEDDYGIGMFKFPFYEKTAYGHTGGIDEFHSILTYFPSDSVSVAFTGNGVVYSMNEFLIGVLSAYYGKDFSLPSFTSFDIAEELLGRYEGIYASKDIPLKITIKKTDKNLTAQATGQGAFPLTCVSETTFKFDPASIKMEFQLNDTDKVKSFYLLQGGGKYLFERE